MEIVKFKKNQVIFSQGEVATHMFEIVSGQVGIFMDYGEEAQKEIGILGEGDFLGELELIDSSTRIASAIVLEEGTTARKLAIDDFNELVKEKPAKVILMIQQLCDRVRKLDNLYLDACSTIDEYLKAEEEKNPKSPSLLDRLKKFAAVAKKRG